MNANQIINMIMRMFVRKAVNKGMNAGISKIAGRGKSHDEMSKEERQRAQASKKQIRSVQKTMRMARRIGR